MLLGNRYNRIFRFYYHGNIYRGCSLIDVAFKNVFYKTRRGKIFCFLFFLGGLWICDPEYTAFIVLAFQSSPLDINTQETLILSGTKFRRILWILRYGNLCLFLFQNDNHLLPCQSFVSSSQNNVALKNSFSLLLRSRTLGENVPFCFFSFCLFPKLITRP